LRKRLVIPWNELTPEEQANLKGLRQAEEGFKKQAEERAKLWPADFDWAEARKTLSREIHGRLPKPEPAPQSPSPQSTPTPAPKKKSKKVGRPPYSPSDRKGVESVARRISFVRKFESFWQDVRDECDKQGKITPGEKNMKAWTRPIHRRRKAALASSGKGGGKRGQKGKK
jgi:hypothetical protein